MEDGRECNTANLSLNWGWEGLLLEPDPIAAASARQFYEQALGERSSNVRIQQRFVTPDNINEILALEGFDREFDLLSIDIDSHGILGVASNRRRKPSRRGRRVQRERLDPSEQ